MQNYVDGQDLTLLEGIFSQPPWMLEDWAKEWVQKAPASRIAFYMVTSYVKVIDDLLSSPTQQQAYLMQTNAPFIDPTNYHKRATKWASEIVDLSQKTLAKSELAKRLQAVTTWKA